METTRTDLASQSSTSLHAGIPRISIIIPVHNKLAFTKQCLDRIWRNTPRSLYQDVIIVDGASTDGTQEYFRKWADPKNNVVYHRLEERASFAKANNIGAGLSTAQRLLFLNNDTMAQPHWLDQMAALMDSDTSIGVVGIKQLFPYTNLIYHTGIVFTADLGPQHVYAYADATLPHVNKQREYQAVTGSCFLIEKTFFQECGGFDENYLNGYEDIDLCMAVRARARRIFCCTTAYIYHYGQITRGLAVEDDQNAARFFAKWKSAIRVDVDDYARVDGVQISPVPLVQQAKQREGKGTAPIYFLDDLSTGSAFTWVIADLALALKRLGRSVYVKQATLSDSLDSDSRRQLAAMMATRPDPDGIQIKWTHYWPQHLNLELTSKINLEFFAINYLFAHPHNEPWDYWMQTLRQDGYHKLPIAQFCKDVLLQAGVRESECDVFHLGYSKEISEIGSGQEVRDGLRFFTVTNSWDLQRYGTRLLLDAYWETFRPAEPVTLVIKDYGASSTDTSLRDLLRNPVGRAKVEYVDAFLPKRDLIRLYRSCDAFVSAHRGEGFGMKILDAMACGMPVITPLFGGPADYCTPANCLPIGFSLAPMQDCLDTRSIRITNQPHWCEPNPADLRGALRFVFGNPVAARAIGEQACRDVSDRFTWDNAAQRLIQIVDALEDIQ